MYFSRGRSTVFLRLLLGAVSVVLVGACKPKPAGSVPAAPTPAAEERYRVTGVVVSVHADRGTLLVDHDDIPGFMAAMTMEFKARPGDIANARPGTRFSGMVYRSPDGFHLEDIWPVDAIGERIVADSAHALRQDTVTRGAGVYREVGERLPDFALYDQTGAVVRADRFRGKQIVLNFIFTRCPDATMCPAATARMSELQRRAGEAGVDNLELISITLDPEYDTPGVLREYAMAHQIDTSNFSFLTGPEGAIKDLLAQLGVQVFQNGPLITHTLATVLIRESGHIIHRVDGRQWDPADFVARLRRPTETVAPHVHDAGP